MGTVVNVFNSGASDLLHVELNSSFAKQNPEDAGPLVWVPFVEAIVPDIDLQRREMLITPPKGLLELNVRSDERSKKERRQLVRHTLCTMINFCLYYSKHFSEFVYHDRSSSFDMSLGAIFSMHGYFC